MKKNLLIVGAGGHGRCCLDIARESGEFDLISFLDDATVGNEINMARVIDSIENMEKYSNEYNAIFVAIGNGKARESIFERAKAIGFEAVSLIHESSYVSPMACVGKGVVLFPGSVVEANASIGDGCIVAANATINHDAILENYTLVNSNSVIRPNAIVKKNAMVGSHCVITFGKVVNEEERVLDGTVR